MKRKWTKRTAEEYIKKVEKGKAPMRNELFKCNRLFEEL